MIDTSVVVKGALWQKLAERITLLDSVEPSDTYTIGYIQALKDVREMLK